MGDAGALDGRPRENVGRISRASAFRSSIRAIPFGSTIPQRAPNQTVGQTAPTLVQLAYPQPA
jgi:hypothetical protein